MPSVSTFHVCATTTYKSTLDSKLSSSGSDIRVTNSRKYYNHVGVGNVETVSQVFSRDRCIFVLLGSFRIVFFYLYF